VQHGDQVAGAVVGFLYAKIGFGGCLFLDASTYLVSVLLMTSLRKGRHVVILEGYMDVVTCHQFGLDYTAATLGTALTEDHVRILRRYAEQLSPPETALLHDRISRCDVRLQSGSDNPSSLD
jgi:DNA primase